MPEARHTMPQPLLCPVQIISAKAEGPVLLDPKQLLVRLTGATATPEAAVLSNDGQLLYLGRIDNRVADFDKRRPAATESDLRNAIDAVLAARNLTDL